jgi:hypothetical protein
MKALFHHYKVPFPVPILRNSFLLIDSQWQEKIRRAGLSLTDLLRPADDLINEIVRRESEHPLSLLRRRFSRPVICRNAWKIFCPGMRNTARHFCMICTIIHRRWIRTL